MQQHNDGMLAGSVADHAKAVQPVESRPMRRSAWTRAPKPWSVNKSPIRKSSRNGAFGEEWRVICRHRHAPMPILYVACDRTLPARDRDFVIQKLRVYSC